MSTAKAKLLQIYPNFLDSDLPHFLGCPKEEQEKERRKKAFKRICPKNAIITAVEGFDANCAPACVWRVYYEMKNDEYYIGDDSNSGNSNRPPPDLSRDEASLLDFFEKLTYRAGRLDLGIVRKYKTTNAAVVEYFPLACECNIQVFNRTTEEPRMWSIKEAEINFKKIHL